MLLLKRRNNSFKDKLYYYDGDNLCHSECPPGTYQYNYRCVDDCAVISEAPYMEESKCVSECSSDYGRITQYSNECKLCRTLTTGTIAIDGFCESECKQGALLNVNNTCVVPNILYHQRIDKTLVHLIFLPYNPLLSNNTKCHF